MAGKLVGVNLVPQRIDVRSIDEPLLAIVTGIHSSHSRIMLGVTGAPGSGKSTFADQLVERLGERAVHLPMDGYHLSDAELYRQDLLHLKGSPLTFDAFGFKRLLAAISSQTVDPVYAPSFDRLIEQPIAGSIAVLPSHDVVVVEGNYLLLHDPAWLGAREYLDEVWHVEIDDAVRIDRLIARHEEFGKTPEDARHWVDTVDGPNGKLIQSRAHTANRLVELSDWVIDGD